MRKVWKKWSLLTKTTCVCHLFMNCGIKTPSLCTSIVVPSKRHTIQPFLPNFYVVQGGHTSHPHHSKSKSSNFSLYLKIFLLIFDPSTQVTKSSIPLVTKNAVSVIGSVPTRTWPCSISLVAACTVSAIRSLVITTGSLRRQNADTVALRSTSESLAVEAVEGRMPISCSLSRRSFSCLRRKGESGGRVASRCASCLRFYNMRQNLFQVKVGYSGWNTPRRACCIFDNLPVFECCIFELRPHLDGYCRWRRWWSQLFEGVSARDAWACGPSCLAVLFLPWPSNFAGMKSK